MKPTITDNEIRQRYLDRAIQELGELTHQLEQCTCCPQDEQFPVLPSGHPQADIMFLKYSASRSEVEEGVAFYGRSGSALLKSLRRLQIDPLTVYGTLCAKCPIGKAATVERTCVKKVADEITIVRPRIVVAMGHEALQSLNDLNLPLSNQLHAKAGVVQQLLPGIEVLYTPNIDHSLDDQDEKHAFWSAFRVLGDWHAALPPY